LVGASSSAANLQLPIDAQAGKVGVFVGVAFFIRYLLETVASVAYPVRLHTVAATDIPDQHRHATRLATLVSFAFTGLLLEAFMGWTPVLFLIVGLQVLGKFIPPKIAPSHFPKWVYRMVPRGLASMLVLGAVGNLVSNYFQAHVKSSFWQVAGLLIAMTAISGFYAFLSEPEGEDFHISWFTRAAGIVIAVLTAFQLTGHLI
jgi:hypothetical protein